MVKFAVIVEGNSELIFVREVLIRFFNSELDIECYSIRKNKEYSTPYKWKHPESKIHVRIVNTCNDEKVNSYIHENIKRLEGFGFSTIIGIRDMYSEAYLNKCQSRTIDRKICNEFISKTNRMLSSILPNTDLTVDSFFCIMEFEAWLLTIPRIFHKYNSQLSIDFIETSLGINLEHSNPECDFFHPANILKGILNLIDVNYKKSTHNLNSLISNIDDDDILNLYNQNSTFCQFLNHFWNI